MLRNSFLEGITRYWWLPLITGLVCIALGIWAICAPAQSLPVLAMAFAIGLLAVGFFDAIWGFSTVKHNPGWGWDICLAVIDIIAGIWMLTMTPAEMTLTFLYIIGIWLIFAAFNAVGLLFSASLFSTGATILATLLLIGTLFFSFWLIFNPIGLGLMAWIWIGVALLCYGTYRIALAFKLKNFRNRLS
ncbi:MAG: hypothetical protein HDS67_04125 [Bacteroidales bacterium]|nr:hypothetical protein [Bacteroidales bacterium]